jgi:hypothetical protein
MMVWRAARLREATHSLTLHEVVGKESAREERERYLQSTLGTLMHDGGSKETTVMETRPPVGVGYKPGQCQLAESCLSRMLVRAPPCLPPPALAHRGSRSRARPLVLELCLYIGVPAPYPVTTKLVSSS